jgi:hypothetical protein
MTTDPFESAEYMGGEFWKVVAGTPGPVVGSDGRLFRYTVFLQKGLGLARLRAARRIDVTLADARGWARGSVRFQRVAEGADTDVLVAFPRMVDKLCAPLQTLGEVSCCQGRRVVINIERWRYAVPHWPGSVLTYRQMLINHEFGHRVGQGHRRCPGPGGVNPVMVQMTYGLQGCRANSWPLDEEIASLGS